MHRDVEWKVDGEAESRTVEIYALPLAPPESGSLVEACNLAEEKSAVAALRSHRAILESGSDAVREALQKKASARGRVRFVVAH